MKCFYWRRFRTTVSWHSLRHESFGEGEQALTHGAIDAEEHAHFHPYGSPGARFSPASWLSLCEDGAPENCQCFFCSRSRLPLRFKASRVQQSGADSERYASPEPTQDASGKSGTNTEPRVVRFFWSLRKPPASGRLGCT